MAGTGHDYEIGNIADVRQALDALQSRVEGESARAWFTSRKVLKFITSEDFTVCVTLDMADALEDTCDPDEFSHLARKLREGGDVRLFSRQLLQSTGPDFGHVADWFSWLAGNDPKLFAKLSRLSVPQAIARSKAWSVANLSNVPEDRGLERPILTTAAGNVWMDLLDDAAMRAEGYAMSHCVRYDSYLAKRDLGLCRILSLRDGRGRSSVTVEFQELGGKPSLVQAKGFQNNPVPSSAQNCLVELMNHLAVDGVHDSDAAEAAGICRNDDGVWARMIDVWENCTWQGFKVFHRGGRVLVMSPRNPVLVLCQIVFADGSWLHENGNGLPPGRVSGIEPRHYHADEARAFARLRTLVKDLRPSGSYDPPLAFAEDGEVVAQIDTYERREIGGVTCLVRQDPKLKNPIGPKYDVIMVPHSRDEARVMLHIGPESVIGKRRHSSSYLTDLAVGAVENAVRWNVTEASRCMSVMTAEKISILQEEEDRIIEKRFKPIRDPHGIWHLFKEEAMVLPLFSGGDKGGWHYTDWRAEMNSPCGGTASLSKTHDGLVGRVWFWAAPPEFTEEIAAFLNHFGWQPARNVGGMEKVCFSGNGDELLRGCLYYAGGRWHSSATVSFLRNGAGRKRQRRLSFTAAEADTVIGLFPDGHLSEEADLVLAAALSAWARAARKHKRKDMILSRRGIALTRDEQAWNQSWEGRLRVSCRLMHLFDERTRRAVGRLACDVLTEMLRTTRKNIWMWEAEILGFLVLFLDFIPDRLFARAIKRSMKITASLLLKEQRSPSSVWFGPAFERAKKLGLAYKIVEAADWTCHRLSESEAAWSLEDAGNWVACFETASIRHFAFNSQRRIGDLVGILEGALESAEAAEADAWRSLAMRARAVADAFLEREQKWESKLAA